MNTSRPQPAAGDPWKSANGPPSIAERGEILARILEQLQGGSSVDEGFRRLHELYYRPLLQFFAKRGLAPEECLDLTQETFLGIYTGIGSFRRQASFDTWLFKIATNAYRKRQRQRSAQMRRGEEVPLQGAEDLAQPAAGYPGGIVPRPDDEVLDKERVRLLREAVRRLPERMRKCLILRIFQERKYREIGVVMKLSTQTVKAHLHQARLRLQQELGPHAVPEIDAGRGGCMSKPAAGPRWWLRLPH